MSAKNVMILGAMLGAMHSPIPFREYAEPEPHRSPVGDSDSRRVAKILAEAEARRERKRQRNKELYEQSQTHGA